MSRIQNAIRFRKKLPVIFEFKSKAGVKFKVKVDTAIKSRYHQAKVGEDGFRILNS